MMPSTRRLTGPITVSGFFHLGFTADHWHFQSVDEAYHQLSRVFYGQSKLLDLATWDRLRIVVRDEFDACVPAQVVLDDFRAVAREWDETVRARQLKHMGLTEKQGYRFRCGPIKTRAIARSRWWADQRKRHLRSGLLEALGPDDDLAEYEPFLRRDRRRGEWAFDLLGDLWDCDFPVRNTTRNWKSYRRTQWKS